MLFKHYLIEKVDVSEIHLPQHNQIIILAGGAASGKSYVLKEVLKNQNNTRIFNLDDIKEKYINDPKEYNIKYKEFCTYIYKTLHDEDVEEYTFNGKTVNLHKMPHDVLDKIENIDDETKVIKELKNVDLSNELDTALLHSFVSIMGFIDIEEELLFADISSDDKPNIVFDTTLSSMNKMLHISKMVQEHGYNKDNIHIIWIVQDLQKAMKINRERDRKVPDYIVKDTYYSSQYTMNKIISGIKRTVKENVMNGNIWVVYNNFDTETKCIKIKDQGSTKINKSYEN